MAFAAELQNQGTEVEILVCDDESSFIRLMELALGRAGYKVETARDGVEGLQKLHHHLPDLMVVDLIMPRMDGNDFIRHVRSELGLHRLPIIVVTALGEEVEARRLAYERGADVVLAKPIQMEDLLTVASSLLASARPCHLI